MAESAEGGYRPVLTGECINCGKCLEVCPFVNQVSLAYEAYSSEFPQADQYHPILGHYCGAVLGGVTDEAQRQRVASGGYLSWFLETLLEAGVIDAAYCPAPTGSAEPLFRYTRCDQPTDIRNAAGSVYYPVHLAEAVREIQQKPGRYAITALPCQARALRAAMAVSPVLHERILFVMGLVCGQLKTKHFAEMLMAEAGVPSEHVQRVQFRAKRPDKPSKVHESRIVWTSEDQEQSTSVPMGKWFMLRSFSLRACNYCFEVFPQAADAVFMDAWLAPYRDQPEGTSIALLRRPELLEWVDRGVESGELTTLHVSEQDVLLSQRSGIIQKYRFNPARTGMDLPPGLKESDIPAPKLPFLVRWFLKEDARRDQLAEGLWRQCDGTLAGYLAALRRIHRRRWIPLILAKLFVRRW